MSYAIPSLRSSSHDIAGIVASWFSLPIHRSLKTASCVGAHSDVQSLAKGSTLALENPHQQSVECLRGCLWITQDGDTRDIILDAGQNYVAKHNARMLIYALETVSVRIHQ